MNNHKKEIIDMKEKEAKAMQKEFSELVKQQVVKKGRQYLKLSEMNSLIKQLADKYSCDINCMVWLWQSDTPMDVCHDDCEILCDLITTAGRIGDVSWAVHADTGMCMIVETHYRDGMAMVDGGWVSCVLCPIDRFLQSPLQK